MSVAAAVIPVWLSVTARADGLPGGTYPPCDSRSGSTTSSIRNRYNEEVRWEILLLEPVSDWFLALCKDAPLTADKVEEALDELAPVRSAARQAAG